MMRERIWKFSVKGMEQKVIEGTRLNLVPINVSDIEWLRIIRNQYKDHFLDSGGISPEQQKIWYKRYLGSNDQMYVVELKSGERIGTVGLYNIDADNRVATFGRVILLEEYQGKGYAEEFVKLLVNEALRIFDKIKVEVHLDNINAIAIYARSGFKVATKPVLLLERIKE